MRFRVSLPVTLAFLCCLFIFTMAPLSVLASIEDDAREKAAQAESYLKKLVEYEYIQLIGGKRHGTRFSYKLRENAPIHQLNSTSIIPTAREIEELYLADQKESIKTTKSGQ